MSDGNPEAFQAGRRDLDLYTAAKELIQQQMVDAGDEAIVEGQRELNTLYQRFTARYDFINAKQNLQDLDRRSPLVSFLRALEEPAGKGYWKKSALFTRRTIRPYHRSIHVGSAKEALLVCLNECGRVDCENCIATANEAANGDSVVTIETAPVRAEAMLKEATLVWPLTSRCAFAVA